MLVLAVFLLSITCVSASEIDDTLASEDTNTIGLSVDNDIIEDNLQTSEENDELALNDNDETLSAKNDTDVIIIPMIQEILFPSVLQIVLLTEKGQPLI